MKKTYFATNETSHKRKRLFYVMSILMGLFFTSLFFACREDIDPNPTKEETKSFVSYLIKAGNNFAENNSYPSTEVTSLKFQAIFDSSCIYKTIDPINQFDINKLYGVADCSSFHQVNSARFGWNWVENAMHIHAYCYVNGVRQWKELGTVPLNTASDYELIIQPSYYLFKLNGKVDTLSRGCSGNTAVGYKLYPYFGGDESAPHDITIKIKEL